MASRACSAVHTSLSASPNGRSSWYRAQLARSRDTHTALTRGCLVIALVIAGCADDAMAATTGLIEAAEATRNPFCISFALLAYGFAFREADPDRAREALRRGLVIAHDSGNRDMETHLAACLARHRGRTRRPDGHARILRCGHRQLSRRRQHRQYACRLSLPSPRVGSARTLRSGGHHRRIRFRFRSPQRGFPKSTPRSPTSAMSSVTRSTNRSPARVRR